MRLLARQFFWWACPPVLLAGLSAGSFGGHYYSTIF